MVNKWDKKSLGVDVAIHGDFNIRKKEHERLKKDQGLKEELEWMWGVKPPMAPTNPRNNI